jgi:signal transduction histidine kinase
MTRWVRQIPDWIIRPRWLILGVLVIFVVGLEIAESIVRGINIVDGTEIMVYVSFLAAIGVLIEILLRTLAQKEHTLNIVSYKHKLSMELNKHQDWEILVAQLVKFPRTIAPINKSCLYLLNPISDMYEIEATWSSTGEAVADFNVCMVCLKQQTKDGFLFKPCHLHDRGFPSGTYCLLLYYGAELLAILQFNLQPGSIVTPEQKEILQSISEEMGIALQAGLDRKRLSELQITQATLAERRNVSHYLHDHLSQNLSYLCLKLDQLKSENPSLPLVNFRPELTGMLEAANQSYAIVRRKLETIQPETTPLLMNYLAEHAQKISKRANFQVKFTTHGKQVAVLPEVQQAVFYVFQEVFGNIEKHAGATNVEVVVEWCDKSLSLVIQDNGQGFDPDLVSPSKHFGIQIMNERISKINGHIKYSSLQPRGTTVSITIPLPPVNFLIDEEVKESV